LNPTGECVEKWANSNRYKHYSRHNNKQDCENANPEGLWLEFSNYLERTTIATEALCKAENDNVNNQANNIRYIWARPMRLDGTGTIAKECLVARRRLAVTTTLEMGPIWRRCDMTGSCLISQLVEGIELF